MFFNVCGRKRIWRQQWKKIWEIADKNALGKAVCEKNLSYNASWISVGSRYRIQYDGEGAVWLYKVLFSEQSPRPVISASLGKRNQHSLFHMWLWNRVCCVEKSEPGVEFPGNSSASRFRPAVACSFPSMLLSVEEILDLKISSALKKEMSDNA